LKQSVKILAIDREEIILKSIKKALNNDAKFHYNITTCNTALDGLKLIRSDTFDLVFIDLVLPGMNGIEVLRRIKNIYPAIPVIFMSGFSSVRILSNIIEKEAAANEAFNSASCILLKPFTTEEIKSCVLRLLNNDVQN
jgi:CheY-like chemotaxis protein